MNVDLSRFSSMSIGTTLCTLYILAEAVVVDTLSADDVGVCTSTATYMASQPVSFEATFSKSYQTCGWWGSSCSTKYRVAYRTQTRPTYSTKTRKYLTCCMGFVRIGDVCTPEASSDLGDYTTPEPDMDAVTPDDPMSRTSYPMRWFIPIIVGLLVIIIIVALIMFISVSRRKRRQRSLSSNTGESPRFQMTPSSPHDSASGPDTQTQTDTDTSIDLLYTKVAKGTNKDKPREGKSNGTDNQSGDDDHGTTGIVPLMDSTPQGGRHPQGYVPMRSSMATLDASSPVIGDDDNVYSEMDDPGKNNVKTPDYNVHDGNPDQVNESEPYDKLDHTGGRELGGESAGASNYDHLERSVSSTPSTKVDAAEASPYDHLEEAPVPEEEITGNSHEEGEYEQQYDHLQRTVGVTGHDDETDDGGEVLQKRNLNPPEESMYYNTPEENVLKGKRSQQDAVYTNVS